MVGQTESAMEFKLNQPVSGKMDEESFDDTAPIIKSGGFRKLYLAAMCSWLGSVAMGAVLGYNSPATESIVNLSNNGYEFNLTESDKTWMGSIMALGALCGGVVTGPSIDTFGRKPILVFVVIPFSAGWLSIAYSKSILPMLIGRFLTGLCCGTVSLAVPVYLSETATSDVRGLLGSGFQLFVVIGVLLVYLLGSLVEYSWLAIICAMFPVLLTLGMVFMPESPQWLLSKGKRSDALKAIEFLNGRTVDTDKVCKEMEDSIAAQPKGRVSLAEVTKPGVYKPVIICLSLMVFQQWCGINGIMFYASKVFQDAGYKSLSTQASSNILAAAQVGGTLIGSLVMDKAGRRILLLVSGLFMCASHVLLSVFFLLGDSKGEDFKQSFGWMAILALCSFVITFSVGYGPIPWLMMGELLPARVKGIASSAATAFNWFNVFIVTKEFNDMLIGMHNYGEYFFFGSICLGSCFFVFFFVPETKGRSLDEIEKLFVGEVPQGHTNSGLVINEDSERI